MTLDTRVVKPPAIVDALATLCQDVQSYYVDVPDNPTYPYIILGDGWQDFAVEPALGAVDTRGGVAWITYVDTTPANCFALRDRVRALINPGGRGLNLALPDLGSWRVTRQDYGTAITADTAVTVPETSRPAFYAADPYAIQPT